jgi:Zn ribbon nucleic-acid-binding protein
MKTQFYRQIPGTPLAINLMPATIDGLRCLAHQALGVHDVETIDQCELAAINALKIVPSGLLSIEKYEALSLHHTEHGTIIRWRVYIGDARCPACEGDGYLVVCAANGIDYDVECPECHNDPDYTDFSEERFVSTDIDGNLIEESDVEEVLWS